LRKIFGPVQNEDGSWRIRMNYTHELSGRLGLVLQRPTELDVSIRRNWTSPRDCSCTLTLLTTRC